MNLNRAFLCLLVCPTLAGKKTIPGALWGELSCFVAQLTSRLYDGFLKVLSTKLQTIVTGTHPDFHTARYSHHAVWQSCTVFTTICVVEELYIQAYGVFHELNYGNRVKEGLLSVTTGNCDTWIFRKKIYKLWWYEPWMCSSQQGNCSMVLLPKEDTGDIDDYIPTYNILRWYTNLRDIRSDDTI